MKHNPEIWLQAADDVANSFLSQPPELRKDESEGFSKTDVLITLSDLADALDLLNYPLSSFIRFRAENWYHEGMSHAPDFAVHWSQVTKQD
ncbi:hypothetical protein [Brenneria corticis]|uniref:Uncharacterized protein n=1 Tax=Brenneria corticis TaxID=2173106 RepID=A0A2U1TJK5_9GAMM|nr:hypothetical protein [Brenneria sp. CFCC 11842]PWC09594.1 hypothetical protein DDT56_23615 [Brenneria sp. CFCC 11842]